MNVIKFRNSENYKIYRALIEQTGAGAPVEIQILENTLGFISYNYTGVGLYTIVSAGLFTLNKTSILFNLSVSCAGGASSIVETIYQSTLLINLNAYEFDQLIPKFLSGDNILRGTIEIRVYN